jgi:hypothetical protein
MDFLPHSVLHSPGTLVLAKHSSGRALAIISIQTKYLQAIEEIERSQRRPLQEKTVPKIEHRLMGNAGNSLGTRYM